MCTCREIEKLLDTYTDGELDEPRRLRMESHLQGCAECSLLARRREDEARLIRSGDPVPALSAGFTGQVMSNLTRSAGCPLAGAARGEGFFSLRKALARPWLAPALAGLLLLVAASWAASIYRMPVSPGQIALKSPTRAGQAVPGIDKNLTFHVGNTPELSLPMPNFGHSPEFGPAQGPASKGTAGSGDIPSVQPENRGAVAGNSSTTVNSTMEAQPANPAPPQPTSYQELEQQGYTVFVPGYLPPGYSLVSCSPQPPVYATGAAVSAGSAQGAAPTGRNSLLFTYRDQSGGWLTLEIQPLNGAATGSEGGSTPPAIQPSSAQPVISPPANATSGPVASANPGNQPSGTNQTIRQASKNGANFRLTVTGSLPVAELEKVADSLQ